MHNILQTSKMSLNVPNNLIDPPHRLGRRPPFLFKEVQPIKTLRIYDLKPDPVVGDQHSYSYPMLRNDASEPEIWLRGRFSARILIGRASKAALRPEGRF